MEIEEYKELMKGDHVFLFYIRPSYRGDRLAHGIAAELEKLEDTIEDWSKFKVIRIVTGKSLKVGEIVKVSESYRYGCIRPNQLFKTEKDGKEYWNSVIYNSIDKITSWFEEAKKRLSKRIL